MRARQYYPGLPDEENDHHAVARAKQRSRFEQERAETLEAYHSERARCTKLQSNAVSAALGLQAAEDKPPEWGNWSETFRPGVGEAEDALGARGHGMQ